jgi:hypothetical protein
MRYPLFTAIRILFCVILSLLPFRGQARAPKPSPILGAMKAELASSME